MLSLKNRQSTTSDLFRQLKEQALLRSYKNPDELIGKLVQETQRLCDEWHQEFAKAEQRATKAEDEAKELASQLERKEQQHDLELEALKRYYDGKIVELVESSHPISAAVDAVQPPRTSNLNSGVKSNSNDDIETLFNSINDTTAKIQKLINPK